jgi:hypothetical protein
MLILIQKLKSFWLFVLAAALLTTGCIDTNAIIGSLGDGTVEVSKVAITPLSSEEEVQVTKVNSASSTDPNQYIKTNKENVPIIISAQNADKITILNSSINCFSDDTSLFTWINRIGLPDLVISDVSELGPLQRKFYFRLLHTNGKIMSPCYVLGFDIDKVAPVVTIGSPSPASALLASTISFSVSSTDDLLTSLSASQITLGGTATGCSKTVTGTAPNFSIEVSGCSGAGSINVSLDSDLISDDAGNSSAAVTSSSGTFTSAAALPTGKILDFDAAAGNGTSFGGTGCPTTLNTITNLGAGSTLGNGSLGMFANTCSGANGGWRGAGTSTDPYRLEFRNPTYNYNAGGYLASDSAPGIYVAATNEADHLSKRAAGTLEMWVRQDIPMSNNMSSYMSLYMDSDINSSNAPTWGLSLFGTGVVGFATYSGGSWYSAYSNAYSFGTTTWRQIVFSWSANTVKIYIDGLIDNTVNLGVPVTTTSSPIGNATIGKTQWWNNPFSGSMARIRAYNQQITNDEVAALCQEMAPRFSGFSCR